jgi:hypothetical protein
MKIKVNMESSIVCGRALTPFRPTEETILFCLIIMMDQTCQGDL